MVADIISNKLNRVVSVFDIKKKLIELISNEVSKGWDSKKILSRIFLASGKNEIYKVLLVAKWDDLIMNENYYLSEYELYLLFKEYKVNCLLLVFKNGKKSYHLLKKMLCLQYKMIRNYI